MIYGIKNKIKNAEFKINFFFHFLTCKNVLLPFYYDDLYLWYKYINIISLSGYSCF